MDRKIPIFERAPFANQVFTDSSKKKFDKLPDYIRQFASKILEHGNLPLAAEEAGIADKYKDVDVTFKRDQPIKEAMADAGINGFYLLKHLKECLEAHTYKTDKQGNPQKDLRLKLKTLELIFRLRGDFGEEAKSQVGGSVLELFEDGSRNKKTLRDSKKREG